MARRMSKPYLYGWSFIGASACIECELTVEPDPTDTTKFGPCEHMNICGWPMDWDERLEVAQRLAELESDRKRISPRLPVG